VFTVLGLLFIWSILDAAGGGVNRSDIPETAFFSAVAAVVLLSPYYVFGIVKGVFGLRLGFRKFIYVLVGVVLISIIWIIYFATGVVEPGVEALVLQSLFVAISTAAALIFDRLLPVRRD
jgi:hypothetical protein